MPIRVDVMPTEPHPINKAAKANGMQAPVVQVNELPKPYKSTGNEAIDTLAFLHLLEHLKLQKRSGWIREGVKGAER